VGEREQDDFLGLFFGATCIHNEYTGATSG